MSQTPARLSLGQRLRLALAAGALVAVVFTFWPRNPGAPFLFEVTMRSSLPGFAQFYYDLGAPLHEGKSSRIPIEGRDREAHCRFPLQAGIYSSFRFEPTNRANNSITLSGARIVDRDGRLFRAVAPSQFKAVSEIEGLSANDQQVIFTTAPTGHDPILTVDFGEPVALRSFSDTSFRTLRRRFLIAFVLAAGLAAVSAPVRVTVVRRARPISSWRRRATAWTVAHPGWVLLLSAAASTVLSCYPIVFFGKSFLSPNNHSHTYLLYGEMPTVPGSRQVITDDEKGSDLGAAMWYSWPTSVAESRALLKDGELPLWNRYDSGGLPLLGQGQSMFGDPLHWLVLFTQGSAGWWDLKYLLAKFLFAASLAFCVLQLTRHLPAALLVSLSASFIGFFSYRYSHPAFFSFCYAPLVYLAWLGLIAAPRGRATASWLALMVIANGAVMNSGTVKEAYVLLLAMNFCGCLTFLFRSTAKRMAKLGLALAAQLLFILIAAPIWMTFLHTLQNSWTVYMAARAFQIQPSLFIGLFDDIFYRQFNAGELHLDPSANFLILGAVLWFCLSSNRPDRESGWWGPALTCLLALAFVFGVIPPAVIARLPFIGRVYHVDNVFSAVAIVCLLVLAGFGIKTFWDDCRTPAFKQTAVRVFVVLACLLALYLGTTEAAQRSTRAFLQTADHIPKSPFFWGYSLSLLLALIVVVWVGRSAVVHPRRPWHGFSFLIAFVLLHWRHGMHLHTPFDPYVMNPQSRENLVADSSPAAKFLTHATRDPARTVGLNENFTPGYGGAIGLEQVDSVDPLLNRYYKSLIDNFGAKLPFGSFHNGTVGDQLGADLPLFNLLNVRYYLGDQRSKATSIPSLKRIAALDLDVYESSQVWPRAFFTNHYLAYDDEKDFVGLVKTRGGGPFAAIARSDVTQDPLLKALENQSLSNRQEPIVPAAEYRLISNTTSFKVSAPGPGVVVLTEPYVSDDFQLRINGQPSRYFRVNSAFKGLLLPHAGNYTITYSYWPANLTLSLCLAAAGLTMFVLLFACVATRK